MFPSEYLNSDPMDLEISLQSVKSAYRMIESMEFVSYQQGHSLVTYFTHYQTHVARANFKIDKAYHMARAIYRLPQVYRAPFLDETPTSWSAARHIAAQIDEQGIHEYLRTWERERVRAADSRGTGSTQTSMSSGREVKHNCGLGSTTLNPTCSPYSGTFLKGCEDTANAPGAQNLRNPLGAWSGPERPSSEDTNMRAGPDTPRKTARYNGHGLSHYRPPYQRSFADLSLKDASGAPSFASHKYAPHYLQSGPLPHSFGACPVGHRVCPASGSLTATPNINTSTSECDHSANTKMEPDAASSCSWDQMFDDLPGQ